MVSLQIMFDFMPLARELFETENADKLTGSLQVATARKMRVGIWNITHLKSGLEGDTISFDFLKGLTLSLF